MREFFDRELAAVWGQHHAWVLLSLQDIKSKYRRSIIGPFWITLTSVFFVVGLGLVYARLMSLDLKDYLPFLASGIFVWSFIVGLISEGSNAIIGSAHLIRQIRLPYMFHICRVVLRNVLIFLHSAVVLLALLAWYGLLTWQGVLGSLLGLVLCVFAITPLMVILAVACARYRDILPMVNSALQLLFFISPILWRPGQADSLAVVVQYNIFAHFIAVVRDPLVGASVPWPAALSVLAFGGVCWVVAVATLLRARDKIPYWL